MIDINYVWQETKAQVSAEITAVAYLLWIDNLEPFAVKNNNLILLAPSLNAKVTVNKNYINIIKKALIKIQGTFSDVEIISEDEKILYSEEIDTFHDDQIIIKSQTKKKNISPFIPRYTFDNFVVGESNRLAFHAAQSVSQNPGSVEGFLNFNPLFIYGDVGIGKTHLLHSIGNYLNENLPSKKVLYVATEKLTNDYVEAISNTSSSDKNSFNFRSFREKYRTVDVLMIDDVQFLQKKTGLQDVVFHIFNELYQNGKQIILTSDRPPKEIGTLEDRLRSRFEGGLLADIGTPNLEMRIAIIKKKMLLEKFVLRDEVILFLAEQFDSNIRELEGALNKVALYGNLLNKPNPDLETAKEALKVNKNQANVGVVDSNDIINNVCAHYKITKSELLSKKKTKDLVEIRMIAIYLVTDMLNLPLVTIGQIFGGRDHTTVMHSRDKVASQILENPEIRDKIMLLRRIIMQSVGL